MIDTVGLGVRLGERWVLCDVSLRLARGEVTALIGPPEAGKTILLKTIAGLVPLAAGEVRLDGVAVRGLRAQRALRRRIGMSFQNDALFDALTVYENVAYPLRRRGVAEAELHQRVLRRLADVGLERAAALLPSQISGGMRKRVGIARATVIAPELGLFDDPIAGLDPLTGGRILDLIVGLTRELSMSTVIVSNDLPVLLRVASRVVMLLAGRVVYDGAPDGLGRSDVAEVVQFVTGSDDGPL